MRVTFDLPDEPHRDMVPYPLDYPDAIGYIFAVVLPKGEHTSVTYTVGYDPHPSKVRRYYEGDRHCGPRNIKSIFRIMDSSRTENKRTQN